MTNIRIFMLGEQQHAKAVLQDQQAVEFVAHLDHADFILQDADVYRAGQGTARPPEPNGLTRRELEVLRMTAEGHSVRQIAGLLFLSSKTVDAHKVNLMRKLNIHNKAHLVQYAFRNRILSLEGTPVLN
ncbi:MAG: helix-turn-helix transcriptional regulator [Acidobacteriota bacterium]|nr:helix-turn-helix transcriptional regulator [Acidobacteriota bacterium]